MKKLLILLSVWLFCLFGQAQAPDSLSLRETSGLSEQPSKERALGSFSKSEKKNQIHPESGKANYLDYKIISHLRDTVVLDTTLNIQKDRRMNFLRKDLFGKLAFHNQGQVMNLLTQDFETAEILPSMGADAKHLNYLQKEDIHYFQMPTPASQFSYRSGVEQGQFLDSWLSFNTHKRLNISLAYKGMRSLGNYRNSLSSHVNFRTTVSYLSKNRRYLLNAHITSQKLDNQENGGLTETSLALFKEKDPEFSDRGKLDVNLENANSVLMGKRYYLDHSYQLNSVRDSLPKKMSDLRLGHEFCYETKQFSFYSEATEIFGTYLKNSTADKTARKTMRNRIYLDFTSPYVAGTFRVFSTYDTYYQGYNNLVYTNSQTLDNSLEGKMLSGGLTWKTNTRDFSFLTDAKTSFAGDLQGNHLSVRAVYKKTEKNRFSATMSLGSKAPNFNQLLFQSNYVEYNWQQNFKNTLTRNLALEMDGSWLFAMLSFSQLKNYTYFNADEQPKPIQHSSAVNFMRFKMQKTFQFRKFSWDHTLLFQKVPQGGEVFNVPEFVGRTSIYFSGSFFKKKSLYLQTGITANYFSPYRANRYHPVLGEFVLQNETKIGGTPLIDFFINGQIRRTRLFFKAENLLSAIDQTPSFASPDQPYRDFTIRFGLVWNFFN